jgi:general nucleoside transport system ATP-binding protein
VERLIACMRELASQGTAVGLVTHRIVEVLKGADRVTVLRVGKLVHHGPTKGLTADALAQLIVGERTRDVQRSGLRQRGVPRLKARGLRVEDNNLAVLDDVSIDVGRGEIVGVAGVAGLSQPALAQTLVGIRRPARGSVEIDGSEITGHAARGAQHKVAYVPDTRREALVLDLSIAKNASFLRMHEPGFQRYGLRVAATEDRYGAQICAEFDVRPPRPQLLAAGLSGGNQQKLMVGREIAGEPSVIVAHGPTQGLDLAASAAIRSRLTAAAENGAAVIVISADLDEILTISDRIVVLAAGRITDTIDVRDGKVDMVRLGRAMADAAPATVTA